MTPDQKRVGTFLSYKGFHWEPLVGEDDNEAGPTDFIARWEGTPCFRGTLISIGTDHSCDRPPDTKGTSNPDGKRRHLQLLADQLGSIGKRHGTAAGDCTLPVIVVIVNHEQSCRMEDLSGILAALPPKALNAIHLLIWFDDAKGDGMLFRQTDPEIYRKLYNWFHVA